MKSSTFKHTPKNCVPKNSDQKMWAEQKARDNNNPIENWAVYAFDVLWNWKKHTERDWIIAQKYQEITQQTLAHTYTQEGKNVK